MGWSSSVEAKADRSTAKFSQVTPFDVQEPPPPKKANRPSAWQRSKSFFTRKKVAASPVQKAAWDDHDQNEQKEQKGVDGEHEGIDAVLSIQGVSKATTNNRKGSELGHSKAQDEGRKQSRTPPPSRGEKSGPPQEPNAKISQQRRAEGPREGDVLSLEERNMFHEMTEVPEPKGLTKNLRSFKNYPEEFEGLTLHRRKQFDKKMRRDGEIAEMREEARQEILAAEAEISKPADGVRGL